MVSDDPSLLGNHSSWLHNPPTMVSDNSWMISDDPLMIHR